MKAIRYFALLTALSAQTLPAIESGTYVVSFAKQGGNLPSGLLLEIHSDGDGVRAEVCQDGYKCEAKIQITEGSLTLEDRTSENLILTITMTPTKKDGRTRVYLLAGSTSQKQGDNPKFGNFRGHAMLAEEGDGVHLGFVMNRATSKTIDD